MKIIIFAIIFSFAALYSAFIYAQSLNNSKIVAFTVLGPANQLSNSKLVAFVVLKEPGGDFVSTRAPLVQPR